MWCNLILETLKFIFKYRSNNIKIYTTGLFFFFFFFKKWILFFSARMHYIDQKLQLECTNLFQINIIFNFLFIKKYCFHKNIK